MELAINGGTPVREHPFPAWPDHGADEREALLGVLDSGDWWATDGTVVRALEQVFGAAHGVERAVAVTNGTHAVELALQALGIGDGDEVIVPDFTFLATVSAVLYINAVPVIVDVDPCTFNIDPDAVEAAVTSRTRAVIAVHVAGQPADMDRLTEICRRHDLALVEDGAHAHGSSWKGQPVGSIGDAGTFSSSTPS